jgi:hypothetical protein
VVVAVGLTVVEPLADDELKLPGEIEIVVAPLVAADEQKEHERTEIKPRRAAPA